MEDLEPRDLYAMFALVGLIIKVPLQELDPDEHTLEYNNIASSAYEYADAMLEAREPLKAAGLPTVMRRAKK